MGQLIGVVATYDFVNLPCASVRITGAAFVFAILHSRRPKAGPYSPHRTSASSSLLFGRDDIMTQWGLAKLRLRSP